jgi:hypothetical protein
VALKTPSGQIGDFVMPGDDRFLEFPASRRAFVSSQVGHPSNGDNRIGFIFEKGDGWETGNWELMLRGETVNNGRFHVWTDRHNDTSAISFAEPTENCTVTLPGTARNIITVGGFVSRPKTMPPNNVQGELEEDSGRGPTRDGRLKPDLTAPGIEIMAPGNRKDHVECFNYVPQGGTSMAAPHVTGLVALLLSIWPRLTAKQIKLLLEHSAASDTATGATPNHRWGAGKLDAVAAYQALLTHPPIGDPIMPSVPVASFNVNVFDENKIESSPLTVEIEMVDNSILNITGSYRGNPITGTLYFSVDGGDECGTCPAGVACQVTPCN